MGLGTAAVALAWALFVDGGREATGVGVIISVLLGIGLAFAVVQGLTGLTPGKALLGLRTTRQDTGGAIGVGRALLRGGVLGLAAVPTFGLGLATLAWTAVMDPGRQRRGWHDVLARSVVVDVRPLAPEEVAAGIWPPQIVNLTAMRLVPAPAPPEPSPEPVPAPRPAVRPRPTTPPAPASAGAHWRVAFDTGDSFVVEGLGLVGRRPEARPGEPVRHVVALPSADLSLSKTHAQFHVAPDGVLVVMDRGSTTGRCWCVTASRATWSPAGPRRCSTAIESGSPTVDDGHPRGLSSRTTWSYVARSAAASTPGHSVPCGR